ncbi:flagellar assembly protein FliX [Roseomonas xinghualingensis]|uniref:flagellar assembly protein FliX n=1 Tax=Roseomonas xinghualingensis TaxID=2986475 RepID=UPI0021F1338B|nr:flagellar assembly protein FliX [Roseomonas sp. SXEYE001]MCV4208100.1 flagellar assembly protein FliX [Roseomonas sp. SXEYE001]
MADMLGIGGIGRTTPAASPRAAARGGGFRLPGAAQESAESSATLAVAPLGMVAIQEAEDAAARDRRGAARARELLKEMSALQAGMLAGGVEPERLERLALLAEGEPPADPVLADAVAQISLRARIELVRRGLGAGRG